MRASGQGAKKWPVKRLGKGWPRAVGGAKQHARSSSPLKNSAGAAAAIDKAPVRVPPTRAQVQWQGLLWRRDWRD